MTDKDLHKLSRAELLEMLVEQGRKLEQAQSRIAELEKALEDKQVKIGKAGSLAEAAVSLSGVFDAAQRAADIYLENLKEIHAQARETYARIKEREARQTQKAAETPEAQGQQVNAQ